MWSLDFLTVFEPRYDEWNVKMTFRIYSNCGRFGFSVLVVQMKNCNALNTMRMSEKSIGCEIVPKATKKKLNTVE